MLILVLGLLDSECDLHYWPPSSQTLDLDWITPPALLGLQLTNCIMGLVSLHKHVSKFLLHMSVYRFYFLGEPWLIQALMLDYNCMKQLRIFLLLEGSKTAQGPDQMRKRWVHETYIGAKYLYFSFFNNSQINILLKLGKRKGYSQGMLCRCGGVRGPHTALYLGCDELQEDSVQYKDLLKSLHNLALQKLSPQTMSIATLLVVLY